LVLRFSYRKVGVFNRSSYRGWDGRGWMDFGRLINQGFLVGILTAVAKYRYCFLCMV